MARSTHALRAVAVLAAAVLVTAACSKKNDNNSTAPQTEPPTATPGVQSAGDFGLVGGVDHAFEGVGPPVQVALAGISVTPTPGTSGPSGTSGTSNGARATQQGVMRITLDNVSSPLHDKCGVSAGDKINVFWLTDTQFDTALLKGSSLESSLEGRKVGVAGSIFVTESSDQSNANLGLPTPSTTAGPVSSNCTLVADSVSSTATEVLPTVRPRARATSTPKPTVKPTATPKPTPSPTPTHTATPVPTATPTPTST